ncbi:hypothetical protein ABZ345_29575 [Lentzea sp. NPDC005914]|uniref:hypothetical protein n=1 Tax=Lentzea sp. NPDC005914 TaxID=3154572 RepID=UPI0033DDD9CE
MARSKQSPVFLLQEDEIALQAALVEAHPHVRILDDSGPWPVASTTPPVRASVVDAGSIAGVWPADLVPEFPVEVRSNGTVWGAGTGRGSAVQWLRSRVKSDGVLSSGRLATMLVPETEDFVKSVFRILFRLTTNDLVREDRSTGSPVRMPAYRVGPHALSEARAGRLALTDSALVLHPPAA